MNSCIHSRPGRSNAGSVFAKASVGQLGSVMLCGISGKSVLRILRIFCPTIRTAAAPKPLKARNIAAAGYAGQDSERRGRLLVEPLSWVHDKDVAGLWVVQRGGH